MLNSYVAMLERAGLLKCVLLAAASSIVWYLSYLVAEPVTAVWDTWPDAVHELPGWLLVWSAGSVYGALVLFRYIGVDARARAWGLAIAGMLIYWLGVNLVWLGPIGNATVDLPISGAVTAGLLGFLVMRFGTLRFSPLWFAALCVAGGLGGVLIGMFGYLAFGSQMARFDGLRTWYPIEPSVWWWMGHAAWQVLTCIALYFTPRSSSA